MDLISSCKDKLAYFRIKELKDVLTQLGLPKQGKKQDLVERILAVLSDEQGSKMPASGKRNSLGKEGAAKIIDDTYRKMQPPGATDLASKGQNGFSLNTVKPKEEIDDSAIDMKIRCPCGSSLLTDMMIKCDNHKCNISQHLSCVIIPEKPMEGVPPEVQSPFYCEICRINRADPFWVTLAQPLPPVKLTTSNLPTDGTNPVLNVEKQFGLTRADRDLLQKTGYGLQAWCILLNDKVPFRMQWPQYADLQVNGESVRTTNRPHSQLLGINGRDDGPAITTFSREGVNRISLSACDARVFCFGVRIVRRRTVQQILSLVPKGSEGERFEDALARVCRCIGGGTAAENADDSDSDLEVVADSVTVNLRCPMSGSRIKVAGRFKLCIHMACFDLETFVELNQRSRKWQCPICLKNYSLENIIIDPYFNRITSMMQACGEDVTEIDVKSDGSWRVKNESEYRDLGQWHLPDGSLCVSANGESKHNPEILKQVKQEGVSEGHTGLKLEIKRNQNGLWEVSKPDDMRHLSSGNYLPEKFENHNQKGMPMSRSATGSNRDCEDQSVNQDGGGNFDFSTNTGHELDSISLNLEPTSFGVATRIVTSTLVGGSDVIFLSDSEEDNNREAFNIGVPTESLISPITVYETGPSNGNRIPFSIPPPGVTNPFSEDLGLSTSGNLDLFNNSGDDFGNPWTMPPCAHASPGFQLFGPDTDDPDAMVDVQHASVVCPTPINVYNRLGTDMGIGPAASRVQDPLICASNTGEIDGVDDNCLAFGADDPSLQIFLPTQPAGASVHTDFRDHADMSNGIHDTEDWISLSLGGGGNHGDPAEEMPSFHSRHQFASKDGKIETLPSIASLVLGVNDDRTDGERSDRQRSDSPLLHHQQPRSVRPRLYLSIDSDSE